MFLRALITDEVCQEPAVAVRLARRYGLDAVEIRSVWNKGPHELARDEISELRAMVRDAGLAVCAVATPCFKCDLDRTEQIRAHFETLRRCLGLCGDLDAPIARVFTFWKSGAAGPPHPDRWPERLPAVADHLTRAAETAQAAGCSLGVENEASVLASNSLRVADVLQAARHPALGAVWDPGNDLYDPEAAPPYPQGYLAVRPYLMHVHVKDARRNRGTGGVEAVVLGDGEVPYAQIFARLAADGYARAASLETHYRVGTPLSQQAARLPGGTAFSAGGMEASDLCLQRWEGMLAGLGTAAPLEKMPQTREGGG